jgi:protein-S-isoprenylcysteine O-methyltransferase Ste14
MSDEDPFRIAMLAILVPTMAVGVYHRLQARTGERISHKEEGILLAIALRLAGLCAWLSVLVYLINPAWIEWARLPLPNWLRWSGVIFGVLCCGLMYWTLTNLGKNLTDTVVRRTNATLVTTGPYRWVRHPFYVTAGLMLLSATLLSANWLIAVSGLPVAILLAIRTPKEEEKLIEGFGESYRRYMAATPRYFPRLGSRK